MTRWRLTASLITAVAAPLPALAAAAPLPALSLLESTRNTTTWYRIDTKDGARRPIAVLPARCTVARVAWRGDAKRGLVWLGGAEGTKDHLYDVPIGKGRPTALALPPEGELRDIGFPGVRVGTWSAGTPVALTLQSVEPNLGANGRATVMYKGKTYDPASVPEGHPVLAHAFALDAGRRWQRLDTVISGDGADYAPGAKALPVEAKLGTRSATHSPGEGPPLREVRDRATLAKLKVLAPTLVPDDRAGWSSLLNAPVPTYVWQTSGEFIHPTGRIAFIGGGRARWAPGLPWRHDETVRLHRDGRFLLVADEGLGSRPRLYNMATGKLVWKSEGGLGATFWPKGS